DLGLLTGHELAVNPLLLLERATVALDSLFLVAIETFLQKGQRILYRQRVVGYKTGGDAVLGGRAFRAASILHQAQWQAKDEAVHKHTSSVSAHLTVYSLVYRAFPERATKRGHFGTWAVMDDQIRSP